MGSSICETCGQVWTFDVKPRRKDCFRCHIKGVSLGYTYGEADWHGDTVVTRAKKQEADMTARGVSFEPVGNRWV